MQRCIQPHSYLELVYLTDTGGVQVSSNVHRKGQILTRDPSARGKNWSGCGMVNRAGSR